MNSKFTPDLDMKNPVELPDVASTSGTSINSTLDWVGMSEIALPMKIRDGGVSQAVQAKVQVYVDLADAQAKGIHMSRLYLHLGDFVEHNELNTKTLHQLLADLLASHDDISTRTTVRFRFDYMLKQPALKSDYSGWKDYPTTIHASSDGNNIDVELSVEVPYSSTCPCSAALARQLIQEKFSTDFADSENLSKEVVENWIRSEASYATPHSQRSIAEVRVKLNGAKEDLDIIELIGFIEQALQTPVQTAVKREDEQAFARLNGKNLMFCEDAARRLKLTLNAQEQYSDFWLRVNHLESLHAHDAVSITTKGVKGGYLPLLKR